MAKAKQCDKCGEFYTYDCNTLKNVAVKSIVDNSRKNICVYDAFQDVDVCPNCLESLKNWWDTNAKYIPIPIERKEEQNDT